LRSSLGEISGTEQFHGGWGVVDSCPNGSQVSVTAAAVIYHLDVPQ
jgi:hypothetical protein